MMFFEKLLSKTKLPKKVVRALSVAIVYVLVIGVLVFLIISIVPQLIESITTVIDRFPQYVGGINETLNSVLVSSEYHPG